MQSGRRGGAQPGPDGRLQPRGRAGENDAAGGAPSRKGATPRRDPGDCNAGRLPRRSLKRARRTSQAGCAQSMRRGKKTPREDQQGRCRAMGQRKGPATPLPECGRERCRRRDRAGAEECPGATPAYRLMGWRAGNPPWGGMTGGKRESCKGRDGHPGGRREPCLPLSVPGDPLQEKSNSVAPILAFLCCRPFIRRGPSSSGQSPPS